MTIHTNSFGNSLRILRENRGLSVLKIAKHTCLNEKIITGFESGIYLPSSRTVKKLSDLFYVNPKFFKAFLQVDNYLSKYYILKEVSLELQQNKNSDKIISEMDISTRLINFLSKSQEFPIKTFGNLYFLASMGLLFTPGIRYNGIGIVTIDEIINEFTWHKFKIFNTIENYKKLEYYNEIYYFDVVRDK